MKLEVKNQIGNITVTETVIGIQNVQPLYKDGEQIGLTISVGHETLDYTFGPCMITWSIKVC